MSEGKEAKTTEVKKKKNWFMRHKVLTAIIAVVLLVMISSAASGDSDDSSSGANSSSSSSNSETTYRFNDRADKQREDVEVLPGEAATVDGVQMTLTNPEYKTSLGEYDTADSGKTYVVADVVLKNTSSDTKAYNVLDFRIQTVDGQVLDGAFVLIDTLSSGDLVAGGSVSGKIAFEVSIADGHEYVIWKPNPYDAARAIVQVK